MPAQSRLDGPSGYLLKTDKIIIPYPLKISVDYFRTFGEKVQDCNGIRAEKESVTTSRNDRGRYFAIFSDVKIGILVFSRKDLSII